MSVHKKSSKIWKTPPKNWRQKVRERGLTTREDTWYKRQEELVPAANGNGQSPKLKILRNCRFSLWSGSGYFFARIIRPRETAAITSISNEMTSLMLIGWPPFLWETGPNTSCLWRIYHSFRGISTGEKRFNKGRINSIIPYWSPARRTPIGYNRS